MLSRKTRSKWEVVHPGKKFFDFDQPIKLSLLPTAHKMKVPRPYPGMATSKNPRWLTKGNYTSSNSRRFSKNTSRQCRALPRKEYTPGTWSMRHSTKYSRENFRSTIWRDQPGIGEAEDNHAASHVASNEPQAMNNGLEVPQVGAFSSGAHQAEGRGSKPAYAYIERSFRWAHESRSASPAVLQRRRGGG